MFCWESIESTVKGRCQVISNTDEVPTHFQQLLARQKRSRHGASALCLWEEVFLLVFNWRWTGLKRVPASLRWLKNHLFPHFPLLNSHFRWLPSLPYVALVASPLWAVQYGRRRWQRSFLVNCFTGGFCYFTVPCGSGMKPSVPAATELVMRLC